MGDIVLEAFLRLPWVAGGIRLYQSNGGACITSGASGAIRGGILAHHGVEGTSRAGLRCVGARGTIITSRTRLAVHAGSEVAIVEVWIADAVLHIVSGFHWRCFYGITFTVHPQDTKPNFALDFRSLLWGHFPRMCTRITHWSMNRGMSCGHLAAKRVRTARIQCCRK